jgi:Protein of unknown function (DUF2800)
MAQHSLLSPSGAHRWMRCPGSIGAESGLPDTSSKYAAEGTAAHELAAKCLELEANAEAVIGDTMTVDGYDFTVTADMAHHVNDYCKLVREYAEGGQLLVEKRVNFSEAIGVPDSTGTSDAIVIHPDRLTVIDLKYGMGVKVDATENEQLQLYALGALHDYGMMGDFTEIVMVVHQPRLNHVSEWSIPVEKLEEFRENARLAAIEALDNREPRLNPGEKQCRFCKAKATCPALKAEISDAVGGIATPADFADLAVADEDDVSRAMARVELVEQWCKAIRAEVERRLFAGEPVAGFKLVEGRRGNRAWSDEAEVEKLFKSFRLKQEEMYDFKLISPTKAEKILKAKNPGRWEKVDALTSRGDGKPSVAPATDRRPALAVSSSDEDVLARLTAD